MSFLVVGVTYEKKRDKWYTICHKSYPTYLIWYPSYYVYGIIVNLEMIEIAKPFYNISKCISFNTFQLLRFIACDDINFLATPQIF